MKINIDRRSSLSIDRQISGQLRRLIFERALYPNKPITHPKDLALQLDCDLEWVLLAYQQLIEEQLIFIAKSHEYWIRYYDAPKSALTEFTSIYSAIEKLGFKAKTQTLSQKVVDTSQVKNYPLVENSGKVLHLQRVYYADDLEVAFVDSYFSLERFPNIEHFHFGSQPYYEVFQKNYQTKAARSVRLFYATKVEERIAKALDIEKASVCLAADLELYDESETLIEYSTSYFIENLQMEWVLSNPKIDHFY